MSDSIRAALERLVNAVEVYDATGMDVLGDAIAAARAALAGQQGEGPSDEELTQFLFDNFRGPIEFICDAEKVAHVMIRNHIKFARAVLARWGNQPTPQPLSPSAQAADDSTLRDAALLALTTLEGWSNYDQWVWPISAMEQVRRGTTEAIAALRMALSRFAPPTEGEVAKPQKASTAELTVNIQIDTSPECLQRLFDGLNAAVKPDGGYRAQTTDDPMVQTGCEQMVGVEWWLPQHGCDSLENTLDAIKGRILTAVFKWWPTATVSATQPPAEGEVGELVTLLAVGADCSGGAKLSPDQCHRAAELLQQLSIAHPERLRHCPVHGQQPLSPMNRNPHLPPPEVCDWLLAVPPTPPAPVPGAADIHFEFVVSDADCCTQAGGTAPTYAQALSEGQRYLAQYQEDGPHTLELRRIEVLHPGVLPLPIPQQEEL